MFSLLQQTAPAAVETTIRTITVPITTPGQPAPVHPHPPAGALASPPPLAQGAVAPPPPGAGHPPAMMGHHPGPAPHELPPPGPVPHGGPAPAVQTHATDSIIVPGATGAGHAPPVAQPGAGHAPVAPAEVVTTPDGHAAVIAHVAPGTDAAHAVGAGGHEAAASAGMPQLDFSTFGNQIFWLLVALALIYLILSRVAIPRIGRILGDRQGLMTADLAAAEDFKRKAREAEAAYDKALADARAEAGKIVAANKAEIDAELAAAIARADAEISARTAESDRRIAQIRQSAVDDARRVAQDVAAELVRHFGAVPEAAAIDAAVDARLKGAVQ